MVEIVMVILIAVLAYFCLKLEFELNEAEDQLFLYSCRIKELEDRLEEYEMRQEAAQQIPLYK